MNLQLSKFIILCLEKNDLSIHMLFFIWKPKFDKDNLLAAPGAKGLENFSMKIDFELFWT